MRRDEVIQFYLNLWTHPSYLEVGVYRGETFHALRADRKVAVDPKFQIEAATREEKSEYHEVTSDEYFHSLGDNAPRYDVIYLDGLHTFEQTLRDLMNATEYMSQNGVIIIDDILPNSYASSLPIYGEAVAVRKAVGDPDQSWMGDVYRLVYFVQSFLPRFDYATVADNHGLLVIWRGKRDASLFVKRQVREIVDLEFRHLVMQRAVFNLLENAEIVRRVQQAIVERR